MNINNFNVGDQVLIDKKYKGIIFAITNKPDFYNKFYGVHYKDNANNPYNLMISDEYLEKYEGG